MLASQGLPGVWVLCRPVHLRPPQWHRTRLGDHAHRSGCLGDGRAVRPKVLGVDVALAVFGASAGATRQFGQLLGAWRSWDLRQGRHRCPRGWCRFPGLRSGGLALASDSRGLPLGLFSDAARQVTRGLGLVRRGHVRLCRAGDFLGGRADADGVEQSWLGQPVLPRLDRRLQCVAVMTLNAAGVSAADALAIAIVSHGLAVVTQAGLGLAALAVAGGLADAARGVRLRRGGRPTGAAGPWVTGERAWAACW